ncbi:MAG: hypothetical protein J0L75_09040 [Spirochaetes bacterium]|nr:hypothetical protein [Spirochaetota bacterium]
MTRESRGDSHGPSHRNQSLGKVVWQFKPWTVVWIECGNELLRALLMLLLFWYWR